mmetsp:Transcript_405/g.1652  ORF Transcript_405/g.1652 Transcript_405/m.1652 type:complete len:273 (-) Transcript_405:302-1120(-)
MGAGKNGRVQSAARVCVCGRHTPERHGKGEQEEPARGTGFAEFEGRKVIVRSISRKQSSFNVYYYRRRAPRRREDLVKNRLSKNEERGSHFFPSSFSPKAKYTAPAKKSTALVTATYGACECVPYATQSAMNASVRSKTAMIARTFSGTGFGTPSGENVCAQFSTNALLPSNATPMPTLRGNQSGTRNAGAANNANPTPSDTIFRSTKPRKSDAARLCFATLTSSAFKPPRICAPHCGPKSNAPSKTPESITSISANSHENSSGGLGGVPIP